MNLFKEVIIYVDKDFSKLVIAALYKSIVTELEVVVLLLYIVIGS